MLLESLGYSSFTDLRADEKGIWRAAATKDGKAVEANLGFERRPFRVLITVRSEFEPQFAQTPLKDGWLRARYLVPQMTQDELRRVIEGPATLKVMRFESAEFVDQLVNEVVQMPGALPLLSFALSEMYSNYLARPTDDRTLARKHYEALEGGVTGSLRVRANQLIANMDDLLRLTARRVLERLVSLESGEFARRRVPHRELQVAHPAENERLKEVVKRLDDARLIITDEVENESYLELAHDALILGWDRLLAWVREDLERIISLRRLTSDAEEWRSTNNTGLLWDDAARIAVVKGLQAAASPGLNMVEQQFATASLQRGKRNKIVRWTTIASLCLLTVGALWFAYATEQQRQVSEANRLAVSAQLASDLDQALLLAVSSATLSRGFEARSALFSALTRRPHLRRMLHGARGAIGRIWILPNGDAILRVNANGGAVATWDLTVPRPQVRLLSGLERDIDKFVLMAQSKAIAVKRGASIEFYHLHPALNRTDPIKKVTVEGLEDVFGNPTDAAVYALTEAGELIVYDGQTGTQMWTDILPTTHTENISVEGKEGSIFVQNDEGAWVRRDNKWRQLRGPPPEGYVFLALWADHNQQQVVSGIAIDQKEDAAKRLPAGETAFRCWYIATADDSTDCPDIDPPADVAEIGFANRNIALYSTRDLKTGYQRVEYRKKFENQWTRDTLRLDPTFVSELLLSPNGRILVGTVDGELSEYSMDTFASGHAQDFETGVPLVLRWDEKGCRVVVRRTERMDMVMCSAPSSAITTVPVRPEWYSAPKLTQDGNHIFALDETHEAILWDSQLAEIVRFGGPAKKQFSALLDVIYLPTRREVVVVMDESNEIWCFTISSRAWKILATMSFPIRSISLGTDGKLIVGSNNGGQVLKLDAQTGQEIFKTNIPEAEHVGIQAGQTAQTIYVAASTRQHALYKLNSTTGALESANFNRFSGPARVLAASEDGRHLVVEGVGMPQGKAGRGVLRRTGLGLELWDAGRLLPLGDGLRTEDYTWDVAAFSPDQSRIAIAFSSPPRVATIPLETSDWIKAACAMAGRDLNDAERVRFSVPAGTPCGR
jgi:outer membrane protein assembly factor BamB